MKHFLPLSILFFACLFISCKQDKEVITEEPTIEETGYKPITDSDLGNAVIYEVDVRQYSEEGKLNVFTKDLPRLKELGVKVIALTPIFPISQSNMRSAATTYVKNSKDQDRGDVVKGNPYAVASYTSMNKDLGSIYDVDRLVKAAHENEMFVILNWVVDRTGLDHEWFSRSSDFYQIADDGNYLIKRDKYGFKGTDVIWLNYETPKLWEEMTAAMQMWIEKHDVDGFKFIGAEAAPVEFWESAISSLEAEKSLLLIADTDDEKLLNAGFDLGTGVKTHEMMYQLARNEKDHSDWEKYMDQRFDNLKEGGHPLLNYTSSQEENAFAGTASKRYGKAEELMVALSYFNPGVPMIYAGQEYGLDRALNIFEKDPISKTIQPKDRWNDIFTRLGNLKKTNPGINGGKVAASYERIETSNPNIYAIKRVKNGREVCLIANFTNEFITFTVDGMEGKYDEVTRGGDATINDEFELHLSGMNYRILAKQVNNDQ